jgi:hypothetical protein
MAFYGDLQATTASATTASINLLTANPGGLKVSATGSTLVRLNWDYVNAAGTNSGTSLVTVTLDPPMPDTGYNVFLQLERVDATGSFLAVMLRSKATSSFVFNIRKRALSGATTASVKWIVINF